MNNWSLEELEESVRTYIEMRNKSFNGEQYIKKSYYEDLHKRFGRTIKAYEYRMQNISYIYALMGREYIPGLKPAKNVGTRNAEEIERLINKFEGQRISNTVIFDSNVNIARQKINNTIPQGTISPIKSETKITQYNRDPQIVAWILNNANGICECCEQKAPFFKDNGLPFLEVHHLRRLADSGRDTIDNAIALCPNCHRELHYGINKQKILKDLYKKIDRLKK